MPEQLIIQKHFSDKTTPDASMRSNESFTHGVAHHPPQTTKNLYSDWRGKDASLMKHYFLWGLLSSGFLLAGDLEIKDPWIRAVPPSAQATAAFMTIRNTGDKAMTITGASSPIAEDVRPMVTTKQGDGIMGMEFVESFPIPAGGKRILEPGGDHIMLMKLREVPQVGSKVPLMLHTECDGKTSDIRLEVPVR